MASLKQSTARTRMFLMVDSTDHLTGKTGLTVTLTLSKAGGAFGASGGAVSEVSSGWYSVALNTTDTGTLGDLAYHATATGADPSDWLDEITLDVSGGSVSSVTGAVGSVTGAVGSVTGAVGSVTARVTANTDQLAGQTVTAAAGVTFPTSVASPTNITAGTITTATNVTTVNGLAANVITATSINADAITDAKVAADVTIASVTGAVGSVTGNVGGNVTGSVGSVVGAVGSVTGLTASNLDATISSRMATYAQPTGFLAATFPNGTIANTTNITAGTVTTATNVTNVSAGGITAASHAAGAIDAAALASDAATEIKTAVLAGVIEGTTTLAESLRLSNAVLGGKASGLDTATAIFRNLADSKDRVTATVDANGNRTAVTTDLT